VLELVFYFYRNRKYMESHKKGEGATCWADSLSYVELIAINTTSVDLGQVEELEWL